MTSEQEYIFGLQQLLKNNLNVTQSDIQDIINQSQTKVDQTKQSI
jgi:hypothetical protein